MATSLTRREMLSVSLAALLLALGPPAEARRFVNRTGLKAGQFVWEPSQPDYGPVTIVASLRHRLVHIYKAGVLVGISTCHVGAYRRRTPTGVFVIDDFQTDAPDDGRLSWTGSAIHANHARGFPASLGCIRVPAPFAMLLRDVVQPGTLVILASQRTEPRDVVQSGQLFPVLPTHEVSDRDQLVRRVAARSAVLTEGSEQDHVGIIISRASREAIYLRDGTREQSARVSFAKPNSRVGTHVYTLLGESPGRDGLVWLAFGIGKSRREPHLVSWRGDEILDRISFEDRAEAQSFARSLRPGATLVVTDEALSPRKLMAPSDFALIASLSSADSGTRPRRKNTRRVRRQYRSTPDTWVDALVRSWR